MVSGNPDIEDCLEAYGMKLKATPCSEMGIILSPIIRIQPFGEEQYVKKTSTLLSMTTLVCHGPTL